MHCRPANNGSKANLFLILHEAPTPADASECDSQTLALLDALLETLSVRDAAKVAARVSGVARDTLYALALERGGARK